MSHPDVPALVVVVPLLTGLLTALALRGRWAWAAATLSSWLVLALVLDLALAVQHAPGGVVSYALGGWAPPVGIEYRVDRLNAFVLVVVAVMGAVVTPGARLGVEAAVPADRLHLFWGVWQLCQVGLLGITITGDAFNVYVLLEIGSLTTYTLVAMGKHRDRRALTAAFQYLVMGTVGASFLLVGIGYLLQVTGTLNMADMAARLLEPETARASGRTIRAAFSLIAAGVCLKMALFPAHTWLPGAYAHAPAPVSALLASTATKVGVYVAIRFLYGIFGRELSFERLPTGPLLLVCAAVAILAGSLLACRQRDLKRLLAWSSVAQIGYMALGVGLASKAGLAGALLHLLQHALVKGALFLAVGALVWRLGAARTDDLGGLGRRMPWTAGVLTLGMLGLVGVPGTAGFVSKWYLVTAALEQGLWPVAVVVLVGSLLAAAYALKVIEPLWAAPEDLPPPAGAAAWGGRESPFSSLVLPGLVLSALSLGLGLGLGGPAQGLALAAAEDLVPARGGP